MNHVTKMNWDCVEWIAPELSHKKPKRFKVLSIRGSLSTAMVPLTPQDTINRFQNSVTYTGRLIASSDFDSIFDLFTNILSFNDMQMFLTSHHVNISKLDGPGLILRAFLLLLDLHERQLKENEKQNKREQIALLGNQSVSNGITISGFAPRTPVTGKIKLVRKEDEKIISGSDLVPILPKNVEK